MKTIAFSCSVSWLCGLLLLASAGPGRAQDFPDFLVVKGRVLSQTSAAVPAPLAAGGGVFQAGAPAFGGPPLVSGGAVTLPGGASRNLSYVADSTLFEFSDTVDTTANLDVAYPAGHYVVSLVSTFIPGLNAGIDLPAATFPPAPLVQNFSAAQAINATNDFVLSFQAFPGAAAPDDAVLEVYDSGSLLFSEKLQLTDASYTLAADTLDNGKTYEGRLRFRHLQVDSTVFPPAGYGFFSETRFPLTTLSAQNSGTPPPSLVIAIPSTGATLASSLQPLMFVFNTSMDTNKWAVQWSSTQDGVPYALDPDSFTYSWSDPFTLSCYYASLGGGWPSGLLVNWTLSPTPNDPRNFASTNGAPLATKTYSGSVLTPPGSCGCHGAPPPLPDPAPSDLAGSLFNITITNGTAPMLAAGSYEFFTSLAGHNYVVLGNAGGGLNLGNFNYTKTSTNTAAVTLLDTQSSNSFSLSLVFASTNAGSLNLTSLAGGGTQQGIFTIITYGKAVAPGVLAAGKTNNQFQIYVTGQEGVRYAVEASSELHSWSPQATIGLDDISSAFVDSNSAGVHARFYRARLDSSAFAAESLTNQTLNLSITAGAAPLPAHGAYQWSAAPTGNVYQVSGMTATTNTAGTYAYTKTGPVSATIALADQGGAALNLQLAFSSPHDGYYSLTSGALGFQQGTFHLADGPVLFLGNIRFTPDPARSASLLFPANGSPASFSLTNADGYVWTLALPADALPYPRSITMKGVATVDSSASSLPVTSGVLLEPDGIRFADGVTLTLTAPKPLSAHAALLLANEDGSDLHFVLSTNQQNTYQTTLFHFTSAGVSDSSDDQWQRFLDEHLPQAQAQYNQALAVVRSLRRAVVQPPEPPDYDPTCDPAGDEAAAQADDAYIQRLFAREAEAIKNLLAAARNLEILTGPTQLDSDALPAAQELIETAMYRKVDALFHSYSGNNKKLRCVCVTALNVCRQDALLGGSGREDWFPVLAAWFGRLRDYEFDQFRNQHDYSKLSVAFQAERNAESLGAPPNDTILQNAQLALRFKLTLQFDLSSLPYGPQITENASGVITIESDVAFNMLGTNSIQALAGQLGPSAPLKLPASFSETAFVAQFDPCKTKAAVIALEAFYLTETWLWPTGPLPEAILSTYFGSACADMKTVDGSFAFPVAIQNKNVEAVNQTFMRTSGGEIVKITLALKHAPL